MVVTADDRDLLGFEREKQQHSASDLPSTSLVESVEVVKLMRL